MFHKPARQSPASSPPNPSPTPASPILASRPVRVDLPASSRPSAPHSPPASPQSLETLLHSADPSRWWPRLEAILRQQLDLCTQLDRLSRSQQHSVRSSLTADLLTLLSDRQALIDSLSLLSEQVEPFRTRKDFFIAALRPEQLDVYNTLVDRIAAIIESVNARDDQDRLELEKQRSLVTAELTSMVRARGAVAAYANSPASVPPRFQDQKA